MKVSRETCAGCECGKHVDRLPSFWNWLCAAIAAPLILMAALLFIGLGMSVLQYN